MRGRPKKIIEEKKEEQKIEQVDIIKIIAKCDWCNGKMEREIKTCSEECAKAYLEHNPK